MKAQNLAKVFLTMAFMLDAVLGMAQYVVQGYVYNDNERDKVPLVGALVMLEKCQSATHTDSNGLFILSIPEECKDCKVLIRYSGYIDQNVEQTRRTTEYYMQKRPHQRIPDQIIYTQNQPQREEDVPVAVTAFPLGKMVKLDVFRLDEMARFVPGFSMELTDLANPRYGIRGIFSEGAESYFQPRVAVSVDGLNAGRMQSSLADLFDVEHVEVAKGPQGTLSGSGAEAGAIRIFRAKPIKDTFDFSCYFRYGLHNQRMSEAMVNMPLSSKISNRFALRLSASDGLRKNIAGGRLNGENNIAVKEAFSVFISDRQTLTVTADYLNNEGLGAALKTSMIGTSANHDDVSPFTSLDLDAKGLGLNRNVYNGVAQYDFAINDRLSFSNTLGARYYECDNKMDLDGSFRPILDCREQSHGNLFSEEARVNWTIWNRNPGTSKARQLSVTAGVALMREDNTHKVNVESNPHYLYPLAFGSQFRKYSNTFSSLISSGFMGKMDEISLQLQQIRPDRAEQIRKSIESYKSMAEELIRSSVNKTFDRIFLNDTVWENPPDIVGETVDECTSMLKTIINQIASNDIFKDILEMGEFGTGIDDYVDGLNIKGMIPSGIMGFREDSDIPDLWSENMTNRSVMNEASVFADFNWQFRPRLYLTLGGRAAYQYLESSYFSGSEKNSFTNNYILYASSGGKELWTNYDNLSWMGHCILNWKFENRHNLYASASRSERPGSVFYNLSPKQKVSMKPEEVFSYEAGIKGISEYGYFKYYASVYYYDYRNIQNSDYGSNTDGSVGLMSGCKGKARGFGLDGSLKFTFNNLLSIFVDYSYCNARYARKDMDGNIQAFSGNRLRLNPEHTFDVGLDYMYTFKRLKNSTLLFYPSIATTGKVFFDDANTDAMMQKAYSLINFNIGYRYTTPTAKSYNLDFLIFGKNIANSKYISGTGNYGSALGYTTFAAGAPAIFGLIFRVSRNIEDRSAAGDFWLY